MTGLDVEVAKFIQVFFPLKEQPTMTDECFVHLEDSKIIGTLGMDFMVLEAKEGQQLARGAGSLYVAYTLNGVVHPAHRGHGIMKALKAQAEARARHLHMPFMVNLARYPQQQIASGYKAATNLHEYAMVKELTDWPWPEGRVVLGPIGA